MFHSARLMYLNPSATSVALNLVVEPSSFAFWDISSSSEPAAPDIASTSDMAFSKLEPTSTTYFAASAAAEAIFDIAWAAILPPATARAVLSPSPILPVSEAASLASFPILSIEVAHLSAELAASFMYFSFFCRASLFLLMEAFALSTLLSHEVKRFSAFK